MFLAALPVYAQSTGSDPWDAAFELQPVQRAHHVVSF
jgi:hypothetical protein